MPVIDLGAWPEREDGLEWCRIWAVMLFPDDRERRSDFLDMGRRLTPLPSGYFSKPGQLQPRGLLAGTTFAYVYRMAKFHPDHGPSLGKSFFLLENGMGRAGEARTFSGKRIWAAREHARKCFRQYRSVAHLWGAWKMLLAYTSALGRWDEHAVRVLWSILIEKFDDFLSLGEVLRHFGESFSSHPRRTLLSPELTWQAPPEIELLKNENVALPLHQTELELLKDYKPILR